MLTNSSQINLLDRRFVTTVLINIYRCPKCHNEYSHKLRSKCVKGHHVKSNCPILLPCGHNMCENCVYHNRKNLTCGTCLKPIDIPKKCNQKLSNFCVHDHFDMNFYLMGKLNYWSYYHNDAVAIAAYQSTNAPAILSNFNSNSNIDVDTNVVTFSIIKCVECETVPSLGKCRLCQVHYCKSCFDNVHSNSKVLRTHTLEYFDAAKTNETELTHLAKARICKKHQRARGHYCSQCDLICCVDCARQDHQYHHCHSIAAKNQRLMDAAQMARDNLNKGQKDIRTVETQLRKYAVTTLEEVSSYFAELHSFLQNEEKQIMDIFNEMCQESQLKLKKAAFKLKTDQETLNSILYKLEQFQQSPPDDNYLGRVLSKYDELLQQIPTHIKISQLHSNPFHFKIKHDIRPYIHNAIDYSFKDTKISIKIDSILDESNPSIMDIASISADADIPTSQRDVRLVHVTHISSPENFYIQNINDVHSIRTISCAYLRKETANRKPTAISEGYYYMAYHVNDKQWYRGLLNKLLPNDVCEVFLVDFGLSVEVSKENLCDIQGKHLEIPFFAVRCAIYDIMPVSEKWTEVENNLLIELLQNKPARMTIIEKIGNEMNKIDLRTDLSKSVRATFLYTGLARERPRPRESNFTPQAKLDSTTNDKYTIPRIQLEVGEILAVTMLHAEGPHEFYVIKNDDIEKKENLIRDLNEYYDNKSSRVKQIYLGTKQMCCAVKVHDVWHRAIIEEIIKPGQLSIRLVDEGYRREFINWRQAFILEEQFRDKYEFAIHCTLVDIESLRESNCFSTTVALNDFRQMTKNPNLHVEILAAALNTYKVVQYVRRKPLKIKVEAVMTNNKHEEFSQINESSKVKAAKADKNNIAQVAPTQDVTLNYGLNTANNFKSSSKHIIPKSNSKHVKALKRTPIKVTHLVSPGEFYIQLSNLCQGLKIFHHHIQKTQAEKYGTKQPMPEERRDWHENSHCLVYVKYHSGNTMHPSDLHLLNDHCDHWYRGIVINISHLPGEEQIYSVFLRDIGATVCSIHSEQLYSIDSQLDRVTNVAYSCHLACIAPTDGTTWSQSAIDCFRHHVMTAETLSVSMQGVHDIAKSLPIVLWSSKIKSTDALSARNVKYSNINRNLVTKGLAYMVEPMDTRKQVDKIADLELANGEITLEQWLQAFSKNPLSNDIEIHGKLSSHLSPNNDNTTDMFDFDAENHPLSVHLTELDFNPTTKQKAPQAWCINNVIKKTIFSGYPTYIDFDNIVYIHDASDRMFLERMTENITETYGCLKPPPRNYKYMVGQACVAKYHVDSKYYRGIILNDTNVGHQWSVHFIDYGNVETVKSKYLRPYAPYPNLPAMASKYIIDGIKPKVGIKKYHNKALDQMHSILVTRLVSIQVHSSELQNTIKRCSMRLDAVDIASEFIKRGLAEPDHKSRYDQAAISAVIRLSSPKDDSNTGPSHSSRRSHSPLSRASVNSDYAIFSQSNNRSIGCMMNTSAVEVLDNDAILSTNSDVDKDNGELNHLNVLLDRLPKKMKQFGRTTIKNTMEISNNSTNYNKPPPPKKRMFQDNDCSQIMIGNEDGLTDACYCSKTGNAQGICDENEDIIELEQSFAMDYWHNTAKDICIEEDNEISGQLDVRSSSHEVQDVDSEFDEFYPWETSTVFSHFSGIECFKPPVLPFALHQFNCRVISIITPTILQIFPHHTEFRYREMELQRSIKEMIKSSLPPLTKFEPSTLCLARYSKEKVWYRAIIRSYNPNAKSVDVLYVDYLNIETLPLKYVRQCPKELLGWPLRTFRIRLHNIKMNPNVKEHDIRLALHRLLTKRKLFAVVKKYPKYQSSIVDGNAFDNTNLMEVALYESKKEISQGITVYQSLIEKNFFTTN